MRVRIGISQMIGHGIEKEIASFGVQIHGKILKDVHVSRVSDRGHQRLFVVQGGQGLCGHVEHQGIQHANVVVRTRIGALLQVGTQFREKGHG